MNLITAMTNTNDLLNCTPGEMQSLIAVIRLAAELKEKDLLPSDNEDEGASDDVDIFDAVHRTVHLIYFAADVIADCSQHNENN